MAIPDFHEAKSQISKLVERALDGEQVIHARAGNSVVRLIPIHTETTPRHGGQWKGRLRIGDDFDALPDDIAVGFRIDPA